jgi:catechol 2,3-dioxygenase-like lactoylglutathione lyase family enzyme
MRPRSWQNPRFTLRGPHAHPGCGDFCFVWDGSLDALREMLRAAEAEVIEGQVERQGGRNLGRDTGTSLYTRDPDGNLLEFIVYGEG